MKKIIRIIVLTVCLMPLTASAQPGDSTRVFTEENPLVYEDAWDLWPYVFLNEKGEPVGYNIDMLKIIFEELRIPYTIKLKPTTEALNDLRAGKADLMLGMDAHFHDDYATYGKSVIQLFTHSVVHQKDEAPAVQTVADLANHRVIVHGGSFSHHLMIKRGWGDNAIAYDDMQEAVQKAHLDPNTQIVWNTLSLKFLIRKFQYENLELSPVDIQHGEYKFMSNNPELLHRLDSVYTVLRSAGRLQPIQNKWFYPEKEDTGIPTWVWRIAMILVVLILCFTIYYIVYRIREKRMAKDIIRSNNRLALILKTSHVRIWLFNIKTRIITKLDENGHMETQALSPEFLHYTVPEDFGRLSDALQQVARQEEETVTLNVQMKDEKSNELRLTTVNLSVLRRDKDGNPTDIIGTTNDITEDRLRQQEVKNMMLRYFTVFNSAMIDMVAYDENGIITDFNDKAARAFPKGKQAILDQHISINDVLGMEVDLDTMEPIFLTQLYKSPDDDRALARLLRRPEMNYELNLVPIRDEGGKLLAIYGSGRDVTELSKNYSQLQEKIVQLEAASDEIKEYIKNIDYVLQNGNVRMVTYSPDTHTMTIFNEIDSVQHELTQARAIELTDDSSKRTAQRLLNSMDNLTEASINTIIKTTLRLKGNRQLYLHMSFIPTYNSNGEVAGYFGMCRDVSLIKATEEELAHETLKAQEVETVKNAFLRNMSYEIRTPLNAVVGFAELFELEHGSEDEPIFINEIKQNSAHLLKLINDILFLSRLDARMIEFKYKPVDFAALFETRCQSAWFNHQKPGVTYSVDNPYIHFNVEIDEQHVGMIIDQIVGNSAKYTISGQVRTRYDYTGEHLVMAFSDTGCGIRSDMLSHIFDRFLSNDGNGTGLGLSIVHELVEQMGGKITIKSEEGKGTIVWVTIPCKVIELERK